MLTWFNKIYLDMMEHFIILKNGNHFKPAQILNVTASSKGIY